MVSRGVCGCIAALFCTLPAISPVEARPHATTVELVDFHGWHDGYRVSNGIVDVVVVPSIGRIMQYCFTGRPDTSPIWINPAEEGKPSDGGWRNYGGDKVWPAPQGDWGKHTHTGHNWPPDPAIDPGRFVISRIDNGVRLTGTVSPSFGIAITRDIILRPGAANVDITDTFTRPADSAEDDMPLEIWEVTQTRGDETAYLPFSPTSHTVPGGYVALDEGAPRPGFVGANWTIKPTEIEVTTLGIHHGDKVGADDVDGIVREKNPDGIEFSETFQYILGSAYLDNGTDAQIYANDDPAYIELEALSPGTELMPGRSISRTLVWNLRRR